MTSKEFLSLLLNSPVARRSGTRVVVQPREAAAFLKSMAGSRDEMYRMLEAIMWATDGDQVDGNLLIPADAVESAPAFDILVPLPAFGHYPSRTDVGRWLVECANPTAIGSVCEMMKAWESWDRWRRIKSVEAKEQRGFSASLRTRFNVIGQNGTRHVVGIKLPDDPSSTDAW